MNDIVQTLLRSLLKGLAGYMAAKGLTDSSSAELISATLLGTAGVAWGVRHRSAGQSRPVRIKPGRVTVTGTHRVHRVVSLLALLPALALTGCMINKQYARTITTDPAGVVTDQTARSVTMAAGDGKAVIDKTRASAGKTSSVGSTGTDLEPEGSKTFTGAGQMLGAAFKEAMKANQ